MQEHGRIICVMQPRTGASQRTGEQWFSQDYVILIDGRYERRVAFSIWGLENNRRANLQLGEYVTIHCEVEAHEYEGRWFNEVRCYDVEKNGQSVIRGSVRSGAAQIVGATAPAAAPAAAPTANQMPGVPPVPPTYNGVSPCYYPDPRCNG